MVNYEENYNALIEQYKDTDFKFFKILSLYGTTYQLDYRGYLSLEYKNPYWCITDIMEQMDDFILEFIKKQWIK